MRYKSFCMYRPTFFKIALTPSPSLNLQNLCKLPHFPANNSDIIAMYVLKVSHFNEIISDTFGPDDIYALT